jgi:hypothetical protein
MFRFLRNLQIFFQLLAPACISTSSVGGFVFYPTFLPTPVGGGIFDDDYSKRDEVES